MSLDPLKTSAAQFDALARALTCIAEEAPDRMSLSQAIFFLKTAAEDLRGKKPTYSDIRGSLGERIQRTLHTTYRVVCERSRVYPKATGWLKRTTNKADNREKFLSVTPEGRAMLLKIREHLADKF